ncbi:MAG: hypothetical protein IKT40_12410 [Bacilli bacterium]|nr:hypothetical protein [Bacilli bacterium]
MGLDIRIIKIRHKHFNENDSIKDVYNNINSKFVAEFRNIWNLIDIFNPTEEEDENGNFYRFITKSIIDNLNSLDDNNESMRLKEISKTFDLDKFIYIVEFDY